MSASAVIFGCAGSALTLEEKKFFRDADPWAFILFTRNLVEQDGIVRLCDALRDTVGRDAPILIDQEGGRVARLREPLASEWPSPADQIDGLDVPTAQEVMQLRYRLIASELRELGITVNCAPLLDLIFPQTHDIISDRAYGSDPDFVARIGRAVMDGHLAGGVLPVIKHMPGHGRASVDSHHDLPRVTATRDDLTKSDFVPFAALNDATLGMTGHIVFEAIDREHCATQSPSVVDVIRKEIEFDGLLMTDDLSMKALKGSVADRSKRSLEAGCDVVLHCNGNIEEMTEIMSVIPSLSDASLRRADAALAQLKPPPAFDAEQARMRYRDLLNTRNA
ncbi:MAG: glycoside hydrolase family 3 protein [Pseudomonadota bacterium]